MTSLSKKNVFVVNLRRIHTDQNQDRVGDRDHQLIGCMKRCGSFHVTSEPGQGPRSTVPYCTGPSLCSCLGSGSAQCEYTINMVHICIVFSKEKDSLTSLICGSYHRMLRDYR